MMKYVSFCLVTSLLPAHRDIMVPGLFPHNFIVTYFFSLIAVLLLTLISSSSDFFTSPFTYYILPPTPNSFSASLNFFTSRFFLPAATNFGLTATLTPSGKPIRSPSAIQRFPGRLRPSSVQKEGAKRA